jgi:hypothetical protein
MALADPQRTLGLRRGKLCPFGDILSERLAGVHSSQCLADGEHRWSIGPGSVTSQMDEVMVRGGPFQKTLAAIATLRPIAGIMLTIDAAAATSGCWRISTPKDGSLAMPEGAAPGSAAVAWATATLFFDLHPGSS